MKLDLFVNRSRTIQAKWQSSRRHRRTTGQSMVEFALSLPILMLILIGILDLGRITATYVVLTNAAREGARFGASYPGNTAGITTRSRAEATGTIVNPALIGIECDPISCTYAVEPAGKPLQVKVTYPFSFITSYLFTGISTLNLSTQATFQIQGN